MSSVSWRTHAVEPSGRNVTKQFSAGDRGRCAREWRGLMLLARYAPGLAPAPRRAELTAGRPLVVMSRLPGVPLRGRPLDERRLDALAEAVRTLHCAVPSEVVRTLPLRPGQQQDLVAHVRSWASALRVPPGGEVARAAERGLLWLAGSGLAAGCTAGARPVFGVGDGNLANYLWDGARVRVVDFEDSGRSDRVLELAEITEHVASREDPPLDVEAFLHRFDLSAAERVRLADCRRLLALVWLSLLVLDAERRVPRNPPGTAEQQARRLAALLG